MKKIKKLNKPVSEKKLVIMYIENGSSGCCPH